MSDGFDAGTVHWSIRDDGVLGLTVIGAEPGRYPDLRQPARRSRSISSAFGCIWRSCSTEERSEWSITSTVFRSSEQALKIEPPFRIGAAELGNWNARGFPEERSVHDPQLQRRDG